MDVAAPMTGRQRILTALAVRPPDRVPLYIHGINEGPIIGIGRHLTDGLPAPRPFHEMTDGEKLKLVETLFLIHEAFGVDGVTTFEIGHEREVDALHVMDDWGVTYRRSPHGLPVAKGHPIAGAEDLARFRPPEPDRGHLLLLDLARERFRGSRALFWLMRGAFVRSWRLMGMENYMLHLYRAPRVIHGVAEMVTAYNLRQVEMLAAAGLDVLVVEDDIANTHTLLISPAHFREFVEPYNRRLVDRAHALGLKVVRHSDGNLWAIMEDLAAAGYDGLNPLEPQAGMDLGRVKASWGRRFCLLGNIDCQHLLCEGSQEEVDAAVARAIQAAAPGGGYIVCSSNSLHPGVNPENCIAMFQATKTYGLYA